MNELVFLENNTPVTTSLIIAEGTDNQHESVMRLINEHAAKFERWGQVKFSDFKSENPQGGRPAKAAYLNEQQATFLITLLRNNEVVLNFKAELVDRFYKMREMLQNQRQEIRRAPTPVADMVNDVGATANSIQAMFAGVKRGIALSQAIDIVGSFKNFSLESLKQLIPPAEHDTGYLNATQVGEKLGLGKGKTAARKANALLAAKAWQIKEGRDWRLTDSGAQYGEEMPYTRNGHSGYQIRWNVSVLDELSDSEEWLE